MTTFTQDQWIILALVFILGLLVGAFMTAGGRKKWKTRYHDERMRLEERERAYNEREQHWAAQEKDWRERDSLRAAAVKDRRDVDDERPL
jgi:hypothetical protein